MVYIIKVTSLQKRILDCLLREGLNQTQTANKLGCSPGNVNSIVHRLMKKYPKLKLRVYEKRHLSYEIPEKYVEEQ